MSKALGKGLSALISDKNIITNKADTTANIDNLKSINKEESKSGEEVDLLNRQSLLPINNIKAGEFQPRTNFNEEEINDLAESIKANGVVQPIIVRKNPNFGNNDKAEYEIIAGERRWRASRLANLLEIPTIIMKLNDKKAMEIGLIENVQRQNLSPLEEAEGYKRLINDFKYTQDELSNVIGKSRTNITNTLRLLKLSSAAKESLDSNKITAGHARTLLSINKADLAQIALDQIVKKGLNVRQSEKLVKRIMDDKYSIKLNSTSKTRTVTTNKTQDILQIEEELSGRLGMKVLINNNDNKGEISIKFNNVKELNTLINKLERI